MTNWVNEALNRASRQVASWPEWMRRPEVRGARMTKVPSRIPEHGSMATADRPLKPLCPKCGLHRYDPKYPVCFDCAGEAARAEQRLLYFAAHVIQGLSAHYGCSLSDKDLAEKAWRRAQAMLDTKPPKHPLPEKP